MSKKLPVRLDRGQGKTVVLLHGLGNDFHSWDYVLKNIDYTKYRVIALDLLGFGQAPKPKGDYTLKVHAEAVLATLRGIGVSDAIVAGHSMGCLVAIETLKIQPSVADGLLLLGAPIYEKIPKGNLWSRLTKAEGIYFKIFSLVKKNPEITIKAAQSADETIPFIKGLKINESTWPAYRSSLENAIMQTQSYQDLICIRKPVILVHGKLDAFVIKRTLKKASRKNKKYVKFMSVMGPHEITPLQGKKFCKILDDYVAAT